MGRKMSCSSNLNREFESCSSTLVSRTNSLRLEAGRRVFLAGLLSTTARRGCLVVVVGAGGFARGWVVVRAAGAGAGADAGAGALAAPASTASSSRDRMVPIRVGSLGSGMRRLLLVVVVETGNQRA